MIGNCVSLWLVSISACFICGTVAREAIVGGQLANINQFPYQVSIQVHGRGYQCGGGIIGDKYILTAASCVLNHERQFLSPNISIHAGTANYCKLDPPAVTVRVEKIFFPSEYYPTIQNTYGNIAVLKVESLGFAYRANLKRLALPRDDYRGSIATIAGYGYYTHKIVAHREVGTTDGQLRYARVYVDREIDGKRLHAKMIMPFGYSKDHPFGTCVADSGGPLVHDRIVIGILSQNPPFCNEKLFPGIYTRVVYYQDMITNAMLGRRHPNMTSRQPKP